MKKLIFFQLSETVADDRGISARIGRPWTSGGDVPVDRLMWQAVCVVGRRLAGVEGSSSSSNNNNNNNISCLPVIDTKTLEIRALDQNAVQILGLSNYIKDIILSRLQFIILKAAKSFCLNCIFRSLKNKFKLSLQITI